MHSQQRDFCEKVKRTLPEYFQDVRVLDLGSLDINGNNRYLFEGGSYTGVDLGEGANVDIVSPAHKLDIDGGFDVIVSTEMLEHDKYWSRSLWKAVDLLREGGLLLFTCASTGRGEHGTTMTSPTDAPFTNDYYQNLTAEMVESKLDIPELFSQHTFEYNPSPGDLYFWGVKK